MKKLNPLCDTIKFPRQDPELPWAVSSEILTNPKAKNSAAFRKTMLRSRGRIITCPTTSQKPYAVRVGNYAVSLNIGQLVKQLRRLPPRIRSMEREVARLDSVKDYRLLQRKNGLELAVLDFKKHLEALTYEFNRRVEGIPVTA